MALMSQKIKTVGFASLALFLSFYSGALFLGVAIGPPGELPGPIRLLTDFLSNSLPLLFLSGWFLLSFKKWAWYFALISAALLLVRLNIPRFYGLQGVPFIPLQLPPILLLMYLSLPVGKKYFA